MVYTKRIDFHLANRNDKKYVQKKMLLKMIEIDFLPELLSREERQPPQDRMLKSFTIFALRHLLFAFF